MISSTNKEIAFIVFDKNPCLLSRSEVSRNAFSEPFSFWIHNHASKAEQTFNRNTGCDECVCVSEDKLYI